MITLTNEEKQEALELLRSMIKTIKAASNEDVLKKRGIIDRLNDQKRRSELVNKKPARKNKLERD